MDMLAAGPPSLAGLGGGHGGHNSGPCQRRDVREWQHMDPLTGDRLRARLEADRWIVGQAGRYDKVVDSRDVTAADGRLHSQHKQLEVLQARTAQGSLQVVRSRTVSSARWSSEGPVSAPMQQHTHAMLDKQLPHLDNDYDGLQLMVHPLDLTTQRERAGIGRTGSIATRRPPSRPRELHQHNEHVAAAPQNVSQVRSSPPHQSAAFHIQREPEVPERDDAERDKPEQPEIYRSNSTEDLSSLEKYNDEYEQVGEWRRVSKIRRSLQFPGRAPATAYKTSPSDLPDISGCVSKIRRELENCTGTSSAPMPKSFVKPKRHTFITMDSLQEVRGRLRKANGVEDNDMIPEKLDDQDENDDGISIRAEDSETDVKAGRVRSYVYGMEAASTNGTGSLESRRARDADDWHMRRKSYGFEGVLGAAPASTAMIRSDTSTDSGICRSTELTNAALYEGRSTVVTLGKTYESNAIRSNGVTTIPVTNGNTSAPLQNIDLAYNRQQSDDKENTVPKRDTVNGEVIENEEELSGVGRRSKKVEFCKTEVHFAADSGRVNIVETDGKPPPTQNFRRRRRVTAIGTMSSETKSNLPVVHFGDNEQNPLAHTTNGDSENDFRNLVKVKPTRPRSFHMGDVAPAGVSDGLWGVRLRHVPPAEHTVRRVESPISPVPTNEKNSDAAVEGMWSSVAERIRAVEDRRNGGFSTKINFGGSGEPIVESRASMKERSQQEDETTNTTTKISIDLSPSPTFISTVDGNPFSKLSNVGGALKSTSLIMRTIHTNDTNGGSGHTASPSSEQLLNQLSQLRQLYDDADSDDSARADEEVKGYLGQMHGDQLNHQESGASDNEQTSSVPSGSWSRLRKYRQQHNKQQQQFQEDSGRINQEWNQKPSPDPVKPRNGVTSIAVAHCESTSETVKKISTTHITNTSNSESPQQQHKPRPQELCQMPSIVARKDSLRRSLARDRDVLKPPRAKSPRAKSPRALSPRAKSPRPKSPLLEPSRSKFKREKSPNKDIRKARSPVKMTSTPSPATLLARGARQLREHELSYFGVKVNKKTENGNLSNVKPDLLRHSVRTPPNRMNAEYVNLSKSPEKRDKNITTRSGSNRSPGKDRKSKVTPTSPIYQNMHGIKRTELEEIYDFDVLNMDDLTKAADEILQAVIDYAEEDDRTQLDNSRHEKTEMGDHSAITETPKRKDKRSVEEKGVQVSRSLREGQRKHHRVSSSKGTVTTSKSARGLIFNSPEADSTERPRNRRRSKDSSLSPEQEQPSANGVSSSQQVTNGLQQESQMQQHHTRSRRQYVQRNSMDASHGGASSDEEQQNKDAAAAANNRRLRRRERSVDRPAPIAEYHHKTVTSTIRSVAEKAAAKSSNKHTERTTRMERKDCGNDSF